jgi:hypothetical protein
MTLAHSPDDTLLHLGQLQIQNPIQLLRPKRSEHHYVVQTIHELG